MVVGVFFSFFFFSLSGFIRELLLITTRDSIFVDSSLSEEVREREGGEENFLVYLSRYSILFLPLFSPLPFPVSFPPPPFLFPPPLKREWNKLKNSIIF